MTHKTKITLLLCAILVLIGIALVPSADYVAFADIGPKPSVVVDFERIEGLLYISIELFVLLVEGIVYAIFLPKLSLCSVQKRKAFAYAFVANAASFILGLGLMFLIPMFF